MTRSRDKHLARDKGKTTEQLLADAYTADAKGNMRKGKWLRKSLKRKCDGCGLWFDEVFPTYITMSCFRCRKRLATGR